MPQSAEVRGGVPIDRGGLTPRQRSILHFIKIFREKKAKSPTYDEIARGFQIEKNAAVDHVKVLEKLGYVTRGRSWRSITPTDKANG